jgi:3-hydroxybutyryl-CoA dehydratase
MTVATLASWQGLLTFEEMVIGRKHTLQRTFHGAEVDAFGHLSGDLNPLHMDQEFASHSAFGRRVVHGLLTAAVVAQAHTELTGAGFAFVGQELRFLRPLFIDEMITVEVTIVGKKEAKRILIMDTMVRKHTGHAVLSGLSAVKKLRFK